MYQFPARAHPRRCKFETEKCFSLCVCVWELVGEKVLWCWAEIRFFMFSTQSKHLAREVSALIYALPFVLVPLKQSGTPEGQSEKLLAKVTDRTSSGEKPLQVTKLAEKWCNQVPQGEGEIGVSSLEQFRIGKWDVNTSA